MTAKESDLDDACWDGYEAIGMKEKDGKKVPNCVPKTSSTRVAERFAAKILQSDKAALDYIRKSDGIWTITATDDLYQAALRLEKLGLVRFEPRLDGKKRPNGHTIVAV